METLLHLNAATLIQIAGIFGILAVVFAESGLFFGFFLPGDSLLFSAGLLASQGVLHFPTLLIGCAIAAIAGDSVGYWFGAKIGPRLFTREDSFFFHKQHIERTRDFYEKHGPKALVLARFVPVVRTFAPILAGVGGMRYGTFLRYNIMGGILWACGLTLAGYVLGNAVPGIETYISYIIIGIIVVSFLPIFYEVWRGRRKH